MLGIFNTIKNFITGGDLKSSDLPSSPHSPKIVDSVDQHNTTNLEESISPKPKPKPTGSDLFKLINDLESKNKLKQSMKMKEAEKYIPKEEEEIDVSDDETFCTLEKMVKDSLKYISINKYLDEFIICANNVIKHNLLDLSRYNRLINKKIIYEYFYHWNDKIPCCFYLIYRKDKDIFEIADGQHLYIALTRMPVRKQKKIIVTLFVYTCDTDKAARNYIQGCNSSHPFDHSCINEHRLPQILEDMEKHFPNCIRVKRPFINKAIFKKKLMMTMIYQDITISASDIVDKIVKLNNIMLQMAKLNGYYSKKKGTLTSFKKAKEIKMMLRLDRDYRWMYFLDQDIDVPDIKFNIEKHCT